MKRHSKHGGNRCTRVARLLACALAVASLAAPALAEDAGETVRFERTLPAFEENFPVDTSAVQTAAEPDSWSEDPMSAGYFDDSADDTPLMFAAIDPLQTP